ncbi:hypothetical protein C8F01DRAFT_1081215 [Mycena amicta]|nr:hypothetical protein C8F01DRAFT_1081215 [Mycena amicta]
MTRKTSEMVQLGIHRSADKLIVYLKKEEEVFDARKCRKDGIDFFRFNIHKDIAYCVAEESERLVLADVREFEEATDPPEKRNDEHSNQLSEIDICTCFPPTRLRSPIADWQRGRGRQLLTHFEALHKLDVRCGPASVGQFKGNIPPSIHRPNPDRPRPTPAYSSIPTTPRKHFSVYFLDPARRLDDHLFFLGEHTNTRASFASLEECTGVGHVGRLDRRSPVAFFGWHTCPNASSTLELTYNRQTVAVLTTTELISPSVLFDFACRCWKDPKKLSFASVPASRPFTGMCGAGIVVALIRTHDGDIPSRARRLARTRRDFVNNININTCNGHHPVFPHALTRPVDEVEERKRASHTITTDAGEALLKLLVRTSRWAGADLEETAFNTACTKYFPRAIVLGKMR